MRPDLEAQLLNCRDLPSPPGVALRIIELAQDPEVVMVAAADAISQDAALSARMLRIANSPLYASRRRVENLSQALTVLGLNATLTLALGFSLARCVSGSHPVAQERVWRRSVIAALACRLLGQHTGVRKAEELMLAGLLQDIGMLALLEVLGEDYARLVERAAGNAELLAAERDWLGCDHAAVGGWLARQWNLPALLREAILESEMPASDSTFNACVSVSGYVADIWLAGMDEQRTEEAHRIAAVQAATRLGLDYAAFLALTEEMLAALPEVCALFDVPPAPPTRVQALLDQARELLVLRNLREIQEAARARKEADEHEDRARRLAEEVRRDPLTGVYNRGQLEEVLEKEFEAATRHGWPLSLAFIDLDDFKQVNDSWGHMVGDEVLRNFAKTLLRHVRSSDIVARYGGEEFLVVLPGIGEDVAAQVVRRILSEVSGIAMAHVNGQPLHITFSAGLATQGALEQFRHADDLLRAADEALYGAKREGRNRVSVGVAGP